MTKTNWTRGDRFSRISLTAALTAWGWGASVVPAYAAGSTGFTLLRELTEPRGMALAGATVMDRADAAGVAVNPASAAGAGSRFYVNYADHPLDVWSGRFGGTYALRGGWCAGMFLATLDYGEFSEVIDGRPTGRDFGGGEHLLSMFAAGPVSDFFAWGGTAKAAWAELDGRNAFATAFDLGVTLDPHWQRFKFGAALRNLGPAAKGLGGVKVELPRELAIGGSRRLVGLPATLRVTAVVEPEGEGTWGFAGRSVSVAAAGEFEFARTEGKAVMLRVGYRSWAEQLRTGQDRDMLAGVSLGLHLPFQAWSVDYGLAFFGALGEVHRLGLSGWLR